ncbi:YitT family protein [Clostridium sp. MB40-C1]|uniref:YitT family protein n=1 Tax=Clostridium sp. MB40-C1 TaxID=3070996 RepID=UPI0027DFDBBD|nr:YitT family protein [Clostridium sp. MB40-C1]WMJ80504.1 YitT family protein [Clostridium sp. MB40-C1]
MTKNVIKEYFWITIGFLIVAFGIKFFLAPNKIAGGGVMGIAIIIKHYIPSLSVGILMLIMNAISFIIGFIIIGPSFGAKTVYASLAMSVAIDIMDRLMPPPTPITTDLFLATFFGTVISGIGMGIVFNQNSSTGGTDIAAKIMNKFFHIDIGKSLLIVDLVIAVAAGIIFEANVGMYAIFSVIVLGFVIDIVIEGLNKCKSVIIMSSKSKDINEYIIQNLERGCTIFQAKGAYSGNEREVLYTVVDRRQFILLKNYIKEIDPAAFITVNEAHEVLGEGFKDIIED